MFPEEEDEEGGVQSDKPPIGEGWVIPGGGPPYDDELYEAFVGIPQFKFPLCAGSGGKVSPIIPGGRKKERSTSSSCLSSIFENKEKVATY